MTTLCSAADERLGRCWAPAGHSGDHEFENASIRCKDCGHLEASHSPGGDCPVPTVSREPCGYCNGAGVRTATENFLLARLRAGHDYRWVGASSTALVLAATDGTELTNAPMDGWDLGRCLVTERVAPPELKAKMRPVVERWTAEMEAQRANGGGPYWGADAARKMLDEHGSAVNELVGLAR